MASTKLSVEVAKIFRFIRATGRAVLGVEIQHHPLALVAGEFQFVAVTGEAFEGRDYLADLGHGYSCAARRGCGRWQKWRFGDGRTVNAANATNGAQKVCDM